MKTFRFQRKIIVIAALVLYFVQAQIRYLPSPMMKVLAADFHISIANVGNLLSICMVVSAISMFSISIVIERVGNVNAMLLSFLFIALTGLLIYVTKSFYMALFAHTLAGISVGIFECVGLLLVAQFFAPRHRALLCGAIAATSSICSSIAYALPNYMQHKVASWRSIDLIWGVLAIVMFLFVFCLGGRENWKEQRRRCKEKQAETGKEKIGIRQALRVRFICLIVATMVVFIWVNNNYSIYLPTYLTTVKGLSIENAGVVTSSMFFAGFLGAVFTGILSLRFRKQIFLCSPAFMLMGSLTLCFVHSMPGILFGIWLFGFAYQAWIPVAIASMMNIRGISISALAGATALFNGTGHFLTGFIPTVFAYKLKFMSMGTAYFITACVLVLPLVFMYFAARCKEFQDRENPK